MYQTRLRLTTVASTILMAMFISSCQDPAAPSSKVPTSPAATASQVAPPSFVGTPPEPATKGAQTSSTGAKSDVSKSQQSNDMPMPGQANDHSTLAPNASQKANAKSGTP
jgi:PBP1b-binding outer membrane lipoprotein LpoB